MILCLNLVSGRQLARMAGTENAAPVDQGGHVGVTIPLYVIPGSMGARLGILLDSWAAVTGDINMRTSGAQLHYLLYFT